MSLRSVAPERDDGARRRLAIVYLPISALAPDPKNARLHRRKQIRQIAASIASFGFNVPILVDGAGDVIAGHGRLLAAKELGWAEVPTIRIEHLSQAQRRAFMIADNRLTEIAVWDDRLLAEQLRDLSLAELDFNIEVTGFDMGENDLRIESLSPVTTEPSEPAIQPGSGQPVCAEGDLWLLGRHKVLCGSALDPAMHDVLMGTEQAAMIFTDPPYNVPIDGHVSGLGQNRHREFAMAAGEMDAAAFTAFLETAMGLAARHSVSGSLHYVCMDWRHMAELMAAGQRVYTDLINLCVWTKPNAGMGSFYRSQHELIFVFRHGEASHCNNVRLGTHGRNRSNVWPYAGQPAFGRAGEEGKLISQHPTPKPVQMVADALLDATRRGDIILDPFLGSGTSVMAAERTGRRCFGLELDPLYVDLVLRRWQAYTGAAARHAATGQTFDEYAAVRPAQGAETAS